MFLLGDYYYIDDIFKLRLSSMIVNGNIIAHDSRRRPTYLRDRFDLTEIKSCLSKLILHYWFVSMTHLYIPKTLKEIFEVVTIPDDITASVMLGQSMGNTDFSAEDKKFIVESILRCHTINDGLFNLVGIHVSLEEFMSLSEDLSSSYSIGY